MATDHIRYDILAQDALRGMVRIVLEDIAKNGLPGEHHFYITFDTTSDGVRLSQRMRAQYPQEMTVVLQHQFWDLTITEDGFEVGMSFGGVPERLYVPFASIKAFVDPSVQFALQFQEIDPDGVQADTSQDTGAAPKESTSKPSRAAAEQKKKRTVPSIAAVPAPVNPAPQSGAPAASDDDPDKPRGGGGEVVRLDRFRKK
jgi:hypothetical protein